MYPKLVYQLDENGKILNIYRDVPSACKELNYNSTGNIISCCLGNRRVAAGYQWCYQKDLENRINKPIRDIRKSMKSVVRYGMDGRKIDEWESITNAAKVLNLQDSHISSVCNGKRQSCGSYQWRYKEDNIDKLPPITAKRKVIDLNTGKIYQTVSSAAKDIGVGYDTIKKSCVENKPVKSGTVYFNWYDK